MDSICVKQYKVETYVPAASLRLHKCRRGETVQKREHIAVAAAMGRSAASLCALMKLNLHSGMYRIIRYEFNIENVISLKSHVFQSLMQEIHHDLIISLFQSLVIFQM